MIFSLIKKLCPLLLLVLTFACGKNINEPKVSEGQQRQTDALRSDLTLQVDESVSNIKIFKLTRNAWFNLPAKLIVKDGNAVGKKIKIFYNLLSSSDYEFQCTYVSNGQNSILEFEKCMSRDGYEFITNSEDLANKQFPMDKGTSIKLQLINPTGTGIKVDSEYVVEWK